MTGSRRRWTAIAGTMGARLAIVAAGLATSVVTARALGTEGRGVYYAVTTLAAIVAQFANLGLSSSNTFIAAREAGARDRLLTNTVWIVIAAWLLGCAAAFIGGEWLAPRLSVPPGLLLLAATLAPCSLFISLGGALLVADERFRAVNGWQLFNALAAVLLLLLCAAVRRDAAAFLYATTIAALATVLGMWLSMRAHGAALAPFDTRLFRDGLSFAARAYVAVLTGFLIQRTAASVLLANGDMKGLGVLSVAAQVYDVMLIVPSSVGMVLFPQLVKSQAGAWRATREALLATLALMLLACLLAVLFGRWLLPAVFGSAFAESYRPMVGLLPAVLAISAVSVLSQYIVAREFPLRLVLVWIVGLALTALAAQQLYRAHGVDGVAWAQSAGSVFVLGGVAVLAAARYQDDRRSREMGSP